MSAPQIPASVLPADWTQVLENIQSALAQALTVIADRERTLDEKFPPEQATIPSEAWDHVLHQFQSCFQHAERQAAEVEAQLQATQEAVRRWGTAAAALRQRLVTGPAACIK